MFKTILVATDGSDQADKAVRFAADLAEKYQAQLLLLHVLLRKELSENIRHLAEVEYRAEKERVVEVPQSGIFEREVVPQGVLATLGAQILEGAKVLARQRGAPDIKTLTADGDPVACILECAKRERADAIIMGTRGLSDLAGLLLGSVSQKVGHLADCTCITVR